MVGKPEWAHSGSEDRIVSDHPEGAARVQVVLGLIWALSFFSCVSPLVLVLWALGAGTVLW